MNLLLIVVLVLLIVGVPGGYYAHETWGTQGVGSVLGLMLIIVLVLFLVGRLR